MAERKRVAASKRLIARARKEYQSDEVEIDDDANVSHAEGEGDWVSAWVWLPLENLAKWLIWDRTNNELATDEAYEDRAEASKDAREQYGNQDCVLICVDTGVEDADSDPVLMCEVSAAFAPWYILVNAGLANILKAKDSSALANVREQWEEIGGSIEMVEGFPRYDDAVDWVRQHHPDCAINHSKHTGLPAPDDEQWVIIVDTYNQAVIERLPDKAEMRKSQTIAKNNGWQCIIGVNGEEHARELVEANDWKLVVNMVLGKPPKKPKKNRTPKVDEELLYHELLGIIQDKDLIVNDEADEALMDVCTNVCHDPQNTEESDEP